MGRGERGQFSQLVGGINRCRRELETRRIEDGGSKAATSRLSRRAWVSFVRSRCPFPRMIIPSRLRKPPQLISVLKNKHGRNVAASRDSIRSRQRSWW